MSTAILCPVCRQAVLDRDYDKHAAAHQSGGKK